MSGGGEAGPPTGPGVFRPCSLLRAEPGGCSGQSQTLENGLAQDTGGLKDPQGHRDRGSPCVSEKVSWRGDLSAGL